jgi:hypothetical protein
MQLLLEFVTLKRLFEEWSFFPSIIVKTLVPVKKKKVKIELDRGWGSRRNGDATKNQFSSKKKKKKRKNENIDSKKIRKKSNVKKLWRQNKLETTQAIFFSRIQTDFERKNNCHSVKEFELLDLN